jgi:glycosyltransferase involved in cell wall biosynthesis
VADSELINFYQQATLNILPSRDEGFGFSWLEAANFKCPTILSDIPVLSEISENSSVYFATENPQDLADKIGEIYFNKDLRNVLGRKAYKRSLLFSNKKFKNDFFKVIRRAS